MELNQNNKPNQKYLGTLGFIIFIGFLSAFVPLSTDLYLPALPKMVNTFHTSEGILNLTITFFFIFIIYFIKMKCVVNYLFIYHNSPYLYFIIF